MTVKLYFQVGLIAACMAAIGCDGSPTGPGTKPPPTHTYSVDLSPQMATINTDVAATTPFVLKVTATTDGKAVMPTVTVNGSPVTVQSDYTIVLNPSAGNSYEVKVVNGDKTVSFTYTVPPDKITAAGCNVSSFYETSPPKPSCLSASLAANRPGQTVTWKIDGVAVDPKDASFPVQFKQNTTHTLTATLSQGGQTLDSTSQTMSCMAWPVVTAQLHAVPTNATNVFGNTRAYLYDSGLHALDSTQVDANGRASFASQYTVNTSGLYVLVNPPTPSYKPAMEKVYASNIDMYILPQFMPPTGGFRVWVTYQPVPGDDPSGGTYMQYARNDSLVVTLSPDPLPFQAKGYSVQDSTNFVSNVMSAVNYAAGSGTKARHIFVGQASDTLGFTMIPGGLDGWAAKIDVYGYIRAGLIHVNAGSDAASVEHEFGHAGYGRGHTPDQRSTMTTATSVTGGVPARTFDDPRNTFDAPENGAITATVDFGANLSPDQRLLVRASWRNTCRALVLLNRTGE